MPCVDRVEIDQGLPVAFARLDLAAVELLIQLGPADLAVPASLSHRGQPAACLVVGHVTLLPTQLFKSDQHCAAEAATRPDAGRRPGAEEPQIRSACDFTPLF